jgi:hypothetical protein
MKKAGIMAKAKLEFERAAQDAAGQRPAHQVRDHRSKEKEFLTELLQAGGRSRS